MALTFEAVTVGYPGRPEVLSALSGEIPAGAVSAVIGPNASGKTTLLRTGAGLLAPSSGRVLLDGEPITAFSVRKRAARLAFMSQRPSVGAEFSLRESVALGRFAIGRSDPIVNHWIEAVGLLEEADRPFGVLSVGQQQRGALARALAQLDAGSAGAGRVLLADEPCAAMDPRHTARTIDLLKAASQRGLAVVVSLHEMTQVTALADRVLLLDEAGRLVASGPASDVVVPEVLEPVYGVRFEALIGAGSARVVVPRLVD